MIIALMGFDGTGKTSILTTIVLKLKKLGVNVEYQMGCNYFLLNFILGLLRKNVSKVREEFSRGGKSFIFKIWPIIVFLDCIVGYAYFKFLKQRNIAIFDRYFYDFLIIFEHLGYSNSIIRKLFISLPKPDIGFILDVSPRIAYKRKEGIHDFDINYYKIQRKRYIRLAHELGFSIITTECSLEDSVSEVFTEIQASGLLLFS